MEDLNKEVDELIARVIEAAIDLDAMAERPCDHEPCFSAVLSISERLKRAVEDFMTARKRG